MADERTVIIASGDAETRERWRHGLAEKFVVHDVAERGMLEQVMAELKPGILVLDMTLPGLGRGEGLSQVRKSSPATKMIVLSDKETESEGVSALVAGATGYYTRAIDAATLRKAVESVQKGELWVKRTLVQALVTALIARAGSGQKNLNEKPDRRCLERLTHRQREVAEAIARGASNKEIAHQLNVTERTVKAHLTEMFRSVGVFDRLRLALLLNDVPGAGFEVPATRAANPAPKNGVPVSRRPDGMPQSD